MHAYIHTCIHIYMYIHTRIFIHGGYQCRPAQAVQYRRGAVARQVGSQRIEVKVRRVKGLCGHYLSAVVKGRPSEPGAFFLLYCVCSVDKNTHGMRSEREPGLLEMCSVCSKAKKAHACTQ
jgi:hypothetical protein